MNSKASRFTVKIVLFSLTMSLCAIVLGSVFKSCEYKRSEETSAAAGTRTVIIDAGHGGMDGGAVSVTGTLEKDLNLDLAFRLSDLLTAEGVNVIMTRETDDMLTVPSSRESRKMQDLKGRLKIVRSHDDAIMISLHMNKFSSAKYSGLQVYYSGNSAQSKILAELVKEANAQYLQPDNRRECKRAGSSIFLLHRAEIPAVLVECGFVSNNAEAALLDSEEYRTKLACVLSGAVLSYFDNAIPRDLTG